MNKNVLIVLAGGFLIAILVAVLVQASLSGGKKETTVDGPQSQILVATRDLPIGHEIEDKDMKWQDWPEGSLFPGAIRREGQQETTEIAQGRLTQSIKEGQPIHFGALIKEDDKPNFMAARLADGMRAVGISVKAHTMAGGFIGPGDYVDVIVTYKVAANGRDNPTIQNMVDRFASETVIENVRVLAVDQEAQRDEDKAKVARTVTLEVDAKGAEKLSLAIEMGPITLAMRGIGDEGTIQSTETTTDVHMSKILQDVAKAKTQSNGGATGVVRVYNGNTVQDVPVRQPVILDK